MLSFEVKNPGLHELIASDAPIERIAGGLIDVHGDHANRPNASGLRQRQALAGSRDGKSPLRSGRALAARFAQALAALALEGADVHGAAGDAWQAALVGGGLILVLIKRPRELVLRSGFSVPSCGESRKNHIERQPLKF